jgi:hypothetical protein
VDKCANTKSSEMEGMGNNVQKWGTTKLSVAFASLNADTVGFFLQHSQPHD